MNSESFRPADSRKSYIAKILGGLLIILTITNIPISLYLNFQPQTPRFRPKVLEGVARDGKIGTYIYDHRKVAGSEVVMDDIAKLADRVLIDITWGAVMKNDSDNPFDHETLSFYDGFLNNLSQRGLELVIQFSPTRSPPSWLNIDFEMNSYRVVRPPTNVTAYERFEFQLMRYVNYTVEYYKDAPYLVKPIEWCLADEPVTADWKPILAAMYQSIKKIDPASTVSVVEHIKELYQALSDTYDMFTIDPYGSNQDLEEKIRMAYSATKEEKPVRVIISGMARQNDYYMIRRQMILSWFLGAYDIWYWSYNSRWDGKTQEWYVVLYSESGPIYTQRAQAILEGKEDIRRFALIEHALLNNSLSTSIKTQLQSYENEAYSLIMRLEFDKANQTLNDAVSLITPGY